MNTVCKAGLWLGYVLFMSNSYAGKKNNTINESQKKEVTMTTNQGPHADSAQVFFIDKFLVPAAAKQEFMERMNLNRPFIRKLAGFIKDDVYERRDEQGNFIYITVAAWQNDEALANARETVQAEYSWYHKQRWPPALAGSH